MSTKDSKTEQPCTLHSVMPSFLSPEEFKKRVRMGDVIINHWASDRNPHRSGYFVRFNRYKRKLNGGMYVEMTDKLQNGVRWEVVYDRESKFSIVS